MALLKTEINTSENRKEDLTENLSDKEKHGLKYIGGYILHKLYRKFMNSEHWKSPTSQQALAFLNVAKSDKIDESPLMSRIDRGGLWE